MSNRSDDKRSALLTALSVSVGHVNGLERDWLHSAGATSNQINAAWLEVFEIALTPNHSGNFNDDAYAYLGGLGHTGSLPDRWAAFWSGVLPTGYEPGMMTFDGSTGYYSKTTGVTTAGNKETAVIKFNRSDFTGAVVEQLFVVFGAVHVRMSVMLLSSTIALPNRQAKMQVQVTNSAGTDICKIISTSTLLDGGDHVAMISFDGDTGDASLVIDGVDEDDTSNPDRIAPTTGALDSGASSTIYVGANAGASHLGGDVGYFGYRDAYLTNHGDFMSGSTPKELDETTWTEWGSQPLFWNQYGTMSDNKGSAGNMTANGTITGPA